jgi:hypothetical protein
MRALLFVVRAQARPLLWSLLPPRPWKPHQYSALSRSIFAGARSYPRHARPLFVALSMHLQTTQKYSRQQG